MPGNSTTSSTPDPQLDQQTRDWVDQMMQRAREASETHSPMDVRVEERNDSQEDVEEQTREAVQGRVQRRGEEEASRSSTRAGPTVFEEAIPVNPDDLPTEEENQFEAYNVSLEEPSDQSLARDPVDEEPDYLSSALPPPDFEPTVPEILRLQALGGFPNQGSVAPSAEEVWVEGGRQARNVAQGRPAGRPRNPLRRSAEQAMSHEIGQQVAESEGNPTIESIQRNLPIPYLEVAGQRSVNTPRMARRLENALYRQLVMQERGGDREMIISPERDDAIRVEAERQSHIGMAQDMQSGGQRYFADWNHEDMTASIAEGNGLWNILQTYMLPTTFGLTPGQLPENPTPEQRATWSTSKMQWETEHPLWRFSRAHFASYVATAAATGDWTGGEDFITAGRAGDDVIYHFPEYVGYWHTVLDPVGSPISRGATGLGYLQGSALLVASPDALSAAGAVVGTARGAIRLATRVRQVEALGEELGALSVLARRTTPREIPIPAVIDEAGEIITPARIKEVADPDITIPELAGRVGSARNGEGLGAQWISGVEAGRIFEVPPVKSATEAERLISIIDDLEVRVSRARERLSKAEGARVRTAANERASASVLEESAARWRLAEAESQSAEIDKIIVLNLLGVSDEQARTVTSISEYTDVLHPGLVKNAERSVRETTSELAEANIAHLNPEIASGVAGAEMHPGDRLNDIRERYQAYIADQVSSPGWPGIPLPTSPMHNVPSRVLTPPEGIIVSGADDLRSGAAHLLADSPGAWRSGGEEILGPTPEMTVQTAKRLLGESLESWTIESTSGRFYGVPLREALADDLAAVLDNPSLVSRIKEEITEEMARGHNRYGVEYSPLHTFQEATTDLEGLVGYTTIERLRDTHSGLRGTRQEEFIEAVLEGTIPLPEGYTANRAMNEILGNAEAMEIPDLVSGRVLRTYATTMDGKPLGNIDSGEEFRVLVDILSDEGRVYTAYHPRRLDWTTATELNRLGEQYKEIVSLVGPSALRVQAASEAVTLARVGLTNLRHGIPEAVRRSIDKIDEAASLVRQYALSKKLADVNAVKLAKAEDVLLSTTLRTASATAKVTRARRARGIWADVVEEMSKSLGAQGRAIRRSAGVGEIPVKEILSGRNAARGIPEYARRLGQYIRGGWRLSADELAELGTKVNRVKVEEDVDRLVAKNMQLSKESKVEIDAAGLSLDLYTHLGEEIWDRIIQEGLGKKIWKPGTDAGSPGRYVRAKGLNNQPMGALQEVIAGGGGGSITMSHGRWAEARESIDHLYLQKAARDFETSETLWARTLDTVWRDLSVIHPLQRNFDFQRMVSNVLYRKKGYSPIQQRWGAPLTEEMQDIIKATENVMERIKRELVEVKHTKGLGDTEWERLINYADGGIRVPLKTGPARAQEAFLPGTLFDTARLQILADTRKNPYAELKRAEQQAEAQGRLVKKLVTTLETSARTKGARLPPEEVTFLRATIAGLSTKTMDEVGRAVSAGLDLADTNLSKSLVALSRMWIPASTLGAIPTASQARLFVVARGLMKSSSTYAEFSTEMSKLTGSILGSFNLTRGAPKNAVQAGAVARAHAMGVSALSLSASIGYASRRLDNLHFGTLKRDTAMDINKILSGEGHLVKNTDEAYNALNRMGLHVFVGHSKAASEGREALGAAIKRTKELIEVGTDAGKNAFIPKQLIDDLEQMIGKVIKSVDAVTLERAGQSFMESLASGTAKAYRTHLSLWRASVVTGLIFPNPRYWINNTVGDATQMAAEMGLIFALRRSLVNLPSNSPGHMYFSGGEPSLLHALAQKSRIMTAAVAKMPNGAEAGTLPGIFETMFDPLLGKVFQGVEGSFVTQKGRPITYSQVRRWALEDGILEDFVHEELLRTMKLQEESYMREFLGNVTKWNRMFSDHASVVQQRQRLGMYVDLLQKGETRSSAKLHTLNALYDWKHGLAQSELKVFSNSTPFYRFARLSIRQAMSILLEPLTAAPAKVMRKAFTNQTRLKRTQYQIMFSNHAADLLDPADQEELNSYAGQVSALRAVMMPTHLSARTTPTIDNMAPWEIRDMEIETGKTYTHSTRVLPPLTLSFGVGTIIGLTQGTISLISAITGGGVILPSSDSRVGDAEARGLEHIISSVSPLHSVAARSLAAGFGVDLDYESGTSNKRLNSTEEMAYLAFLRIPGVSDHWPEPNMVDGIPRISQLAYMTWKLMPVIGTQTSRPAGALAAFRREDSIGSGSLEAAAVLTGFLEKKYFNPASVMDSRLYAQEQQHQRRMLRILESLEEGGPTLRDQEPLERGEE